MKIKKIGAKLLLISLAGIILTGLLCITGMYVGNSTIINDAIKTETGASINTLNQKVDDMKSLSLKIAESMAVDNSLVKVFSSKNTGMILSGIDKIKKDKLLDVDFVTILDDKGTVLARNYTDKVGDSLSINSYVSKAISGSSSSYLGSEESIELAIISSVPIKDTDGKVIGAVLAGYRLDTNDFVDSLKDLTSCQYTVFLGNKRISTTIENKGSRVIGTTMSEVIEDTVLKQKTIYNDKAVLFGSNYYTLYEPILSDDGQVIGSFFTGKPIDDIIDNQFSTMKAVITLILLICIILIFISVFFSRKYIAKPIKKMAVIAQSLADGDLSISDIDIKSNDEIGDLAKALQHTINTMKKYINDISYQLNKIALGDITSEIEQEYIGDFSEIKVSFNKIISSLNEMLESINVSCNQVNSGAEQISISSQLLAQGATEQSSTVEEFSSSIKEVYKKAKNNLEHVDNVASYVDKSVDGIEKGNLKMNEMLDAMNAISNSSEEIKDVIKLIENIVFQTNVLSLNAAVEAANAGEAGKGFAVVAQEVQSLSTKSAVALSKTTELLEKSMNDIKKGVVISKDTADTLKNISSNSLKIKRIMDEIETSSNEQTTAISEITQGIEQLSFAIQNNSATSQESAAASEELSGQASLLKDEVDKFKLKRI